MTAEFRISRDLRARPPVGFARAIVLPAVLAVALAGTLSGCGGPEYEGVRLAGHVSRQYVDSVAVSLERAGENGPQLLDAFRRVGDEDRDALSFLVANLPSVDLATVSSDFLLATVELARETRERYPWGATVPDDVYLRYVLPPRVSQEPLEEWRPWLLQRLAPRLEGIESMEEAALEVNRWCGENVAFKPTQRRDQGVFETLASGYGRCEEMMIVHIAALRSVCIPARQAWTPFWTTCDNNHAWTELWVDGGWHYTGACEPRDALDDAWFNDRVRGAALVVSSVYGSPSADDVVYREEERYALINSIANYTDAGTLTVSVTDAGLAVEGEPVTVSVWNFGALRAIARMETDPDGAATIQLGRGTYFVCAGGPESYDWELADVEPACETRTSLDLSEVPALAGEFWLRYTAEEGPVGGESAGEACED